MTRATPHDRFEGGWITSMALGGGSTIEGDLGHPQAKWGCLPKVLRVSFNHPYFIFGVVEPPPRGIGGGSATLKPSHPSYFFVFCFFFLSIF